MIAVYLLSLVISAGLTGLFSYQVLAGLGFVPALRAGLYLAVGVAFLYITIQTLYMLLVQAYKPTRDRTPLFFESLSHAAAVVLVPYLLRINISWPTETLEKLEPLLLLGAFAGLQGFLKLVSFFAAIRGLPGPRRYALGWLGATGAAALVSYLGLMSWIGVLERTRPAAAAAAALHEAGGQHALARPVQEGSMLTLDLAQEPGRGLTLLWAGDPESDESALRRIHVIIQAQGDQERRLVRELRLAPEGWTPLRITPEELPPGVRSCRVVWNAGETPKWQKLNVLQPVVTSGRRMYVAGPAFWEPRNADSAPNLVLVVVDGLLGHKRTGAPVAAVSLPSLDALADVSVVFDNAYTPVPEASGAVLSLLTGLPPLQHGWLNGQTPSLPEEPVTLQERLRAQGYTTAAFTEGRASGDLVAGQGFERGFDLVDDKSAVAALSVTPEDRAAETVASGNPLVAARALTWMEANEGAKHMALVRLARLRDVTGDAPDAAALHELDQQIAALLRPLRRSGHTVIVVTSPCGYRALAAEGTPPAELLGESTLHVPCMLFAPRLAPARHEEVLSLEDLNPAILRTLAGATDLGGKEPALLGGNEAVSVCGDPLALSIRSGKWRFTWQTELSALTPGGGPGVGTATLYDVARMRKGSATNQSTREKQTAQRLYEHLQVYLQAHRPTAQ